MRRGAVLVLLGASIAWAGSVPSSAQIPKTDLAPAQSCTSPTNHITLFAERLSRSKIGYGLTPKKAHVPGPTIQMNEGDCLAVNLINDTNVSLSLHVHGVSYTPASDGTPHNRGCVPPGGSRTYIWDALLPSTDANGNVTPGSAGYWPYHDHCAGTPHGTGGINAGLFGALIVRRAGDLVPDKPPFIVVMGPGMTINRKRAPHTPIFKANQGQRVEFVVIGMGDLFHTFHLHGHRWADNRTGLLASPSDNTRVIDNKTVGPADSFGFQVVAGQDVGPGAWMYHCHVQSHSDAGMAGIFLVRTSDGKMTKQETAALKRWKRIEGHHGHHM